MLQLRTKLKSIIALKSPQNTYKWIIFSQKVHILVTIELLNIEKGIQQNVCKLTYSKQCLFYHESVFIRNMSYHALLEKSLYYFSFLFFYLLWTILTIDIKSLYSKRFLYHKNDFAKKISYHRLFEKSLQKKQLINEN